MKKLRLLLFEECNRNCNGCCNKDWDLSKLPIVESYRGYDEIILTGGEPMLHPMFVMTTIGQILLETTAPIYLYTAKVDDIKETRKIIRYTDGVCVTLHEQRDVVPFIQLNKSLIESPILGKSFRLNIFRGINIEKENTYEWKVKDNIEWIKDCPLPEGEVFMRLGGDDALA